MINLQKIADCQTPPPLFERGAPMWNDPYISKQMLKYHLDESNDIASRRSQIIDKTIDWLMYKLTLRSGMSLLDLGCGPGLYTKRFAQFGIQTTGIDYSQQSIDYAKNHDAVTTYICQNYINMDFADGSFDMVMMIYGDFCVLSNEERDDLLTKIHRILKNGGYFVFDVSQPNVHQFLKNLNQSSVSSGSGFWKPTPYLLLEQGFVYSNDITLHQYVVIEDRGTQTDYRNWYHDYTAQTITPILREHDFGAIEIFADLVGTSYTVTSDWCGVIAKCLK